MQINDHAVNTVKFVMVAVCTQVVAYKQKNKQSTRHPDRQTNDIQGGIDPLGAEISQGDFKVVPEHFCKL